MNLKNKKILVTGGAGFLGTYVVSELMKEGTLKRNIIIPRSKTHDLRKKNVVNKLVSQSDIVIHLAGNVGGIGKNMKYPGTLFYDNALMGIHLIHAAMRHKVKKIVVLGTICAYPKHTAIPFKEKDLWLGYPEETNAPYGLAKKMLLVQLQSYRAQYGLSGIFLLPVNLYGPGDNFDLESSHVIPALIRKIHEAKEGNKEVVVWGDGSPTREFLHVSDAARAIIMATKNYDKPDPVNLGSGFEISIKDLAAIIAKEMRYNGKVIWDTTKPNGQPKRMLDVSLAKKEFGFKAMITFKKGLAETVQWYLKQNIDAI